MTKAACSLRCVVPQESWSSIDCMEHRSSCNFVTPYHACVRAKHCEKGDCPYYFQRSVETFVRITSVRYILLNMEYTIKSVV